MKGGKGEKAAKEGKKIDCRTICKMEKKKRRGWNGDASHLMVPGSLRVLIISCKYMIMRPRVFEHTW